MIGIKRKSILNLILVLIFLSGCIEDENTIPVANAGRNQTVDINTLVTLDGSDSTDADGDFLNYSWTAKEGNPAKVNLVSTDNAASRKFTPTIAGTYTFILIVNDGIVDSLPVEVVITVNDPPVVANAGSDQTVNINTLVTLDGSASSGADGDTLTYSWTAKSGNPATDALSSTTAVSPTFTPTALGTYTFILIVNDGIVDSLPVEVVITVNDPPVVANAGSDQTVNINTLVTLDGSASSGADGDTLTYSWTAKSGNPATDALSSTTAVSPTFTPTALGTYTFELIVNDGTIDSSPDEVDIIVTAAAPYTVVSQVTIPSAGTHNLRSIAYGGGTFVAVGVNTNGNSGIGYYSTDAGRTWTQNISAGEPLEQIIYADSKFSAIGDNGRLSRSDAGQTSWTHSKLQVGGNPSGGDWESIAFNPASSGRYVISRNAGRTAYTDGTSINFTEVTTGELGTFFSSVFGNDTFFVAGDNGKIAHSTDNGLNWIVNTVDSDNDRFISMAYGSSGGLMAITSPGGFFISATGTGGWTEYVFTVFVGIARTAQNVRYLNNRYVLAGDEFVSFSDTGAQDSWTTFASEAVDDNLNALWNDVSYNNNEYIFVGNAGKILIVQQN